MLLRTAFLRGFWNVLTACVVMMWPVFVLAQSPAPTPTVPAATTEEEEDGGFSWGVDLDLVSEYNWRGTILNPDPSIQPGIWASIYGFTASIWAQIATEAQVIDDVEQESFEEIDLTLAYEHSFGNFQLGAGYIRYEYPGFEDVDGTNELYVSLGYDALIAPSLSVYRDLDVESWYMELGLAPEFTVFDKATFTPSGLVAFYLFDGEDLQSSLNRFSLGAELSYPLGSVFSVSGQVHWEIPFGDEEDFEEEGFFENRVWGGIGLHLEM